MTDRQRYLSALKFHFGNLIHGYGPGDYGPPSRTVLRLYYAIAKDRAGALYPRGVEA